MSGQEEGDGARPAVPYGDFARLDLRVARILSVDPIPGKTRIAKGRADLGGGDVRDVVIGGADRYAPGDLAGRSVVVVANLEPRRVAGVESRAMLLAADVGGVPHWLAASPPPGCAEPAPPGSPVR